jgi:outer membrane receptor for ferrienterochelin and colicin
MRILYSTLCLLLTLNLAVAQTGRIAGTLSDSTTAKPVPFATVALYAADGKLITGVATTDAGTFALEKLPLGTYRAVFSFVGYRTKTIDNLLLTADKPAAELGNVPIATGANTLAEVTVTGIKPMVEDKGDRLVYNAEQDIANAGGTAVDVMRKVPMLTVDLDGNLKMRGSSNIKVLVNGKPSSIMARNLAEALKQMPANTIKSVEVISSPGAKYDAEGSAGVINIITKKALKGFNGSVNATAGDLNSSVGGKLSVKGEKLGFSVSGTGYTFRNLGWNESTRTALDPESRQPLSTLFTRNDRDNRGYGGYSEMALDYDPDSSNRISFSANVWGGNFPNNNTLINTLTVGKAVVQDFSRDVKFRNPYGNGEFNLGWTKTFKKPGKELSLLTQYSHMPDNYFYDITQRNRGSEAITYLERGINLSRNNEYTAQADYTLPFEKKTAHDTLSYKLELGGKGIERRIGSEFTIDQSLTGNPADYRLDPARSSDFGYTQRVAAGYVSLRMESKRKWNLTGGLRYEYTGISGDFITTKTTFDNHYGNLVPSATIAKSWGKHTYKLSYTQRISRPLVWFLNPFVNASDSKNLQTGNPYLAPELTHSTELAYSTYNDKGMSANVAVYWRQTNNSIEWIQTVGADGVSLTRPENIGRNASYGLNANLTLQPSKAANISTGLDLTYLDLSSVATNQRNSGMVWSMNGNASYKLPKDWTLQANGNYGSGWVGLQGNFGGYYWYSLAGKKEFWKKKADLTLALNNPFDEGVHQRSELFANTFVADTRSFWVSRSYRLTFSYRFGQMSSGGKESRKIRNDDSKGGGR